MEVQVSRVHFPRVRLIGAIVAALLLAAACGGGGGLDVVGSGGTGIVNGSVTKGPVGNASVTVYRLANGQVGAQIGTGSTDANGNFTLNIGAHVGPAMVKVGGGTYKDEATGLSMTIGPSDALTAVVPDIASASSTSAVQVTPVTTMAQGMAQQMIGGMTEANIASANAAMGRYFAVSDILRVHPMNPLVAGSGAGASQEARNYGMTLAAMSQYAKTLDLPVSSAIVTAMMRDASDGLMDGRMGAAQISMPMGGMMGARMMAATSGTSSLAASMSEFLESGSNVSGVTVPEMAPLMEKLATSNGQI
jgi:hypothetical protein